MNIVASSETAMPQLWVAQVVASVGGALAAMAVGGSRLKPLLRGVWRSTGCDIANEKSRAKEWL